MEKIPIIKMVNISKNFGAVKALQDVNFEVYPCEVVALVGDNGAGKSTLMKILAGVYPPSKGEIFIEGEKVNFTSPADAISRGIQMIYQDLAVADNIDVAGNIFLGRELEKKALGGFTKIIDKKRMEELAWEALERVKINIGSVREKVENLSGGQRQAVAIARAISAKAKIIIMDEPAAALGVKETHELLELIKDLKEKKIAVVYISHRLENIFEVSDRVIVLKGGKRIADRQTKDTTMEKIRQLIVEGV
ncbi:sugar ABC transporter ATP-binding protein [Candidatus Aerophobetes bacterium]|uniref:Sugar ABC transporter ATP-binding protein n=2 Tax=Aerophobetes bacterium TaxID=2030807 RepID=A0A662DMH9_UNCAE|nr:MAG: sugar ABC transporter ATP-binding protein [Candidatus Aerophobetes bacterium]